MTDVSSPSTIDECGLVTMSVETIGSSVYWRMPLSVAARRPLRIASLISSTRRLAVGLERQVDDRAGRDGGADGEAVQLAVELGQHEADGLGGAGRRRDQVERGGAGAAQVGVRHVLQALVGRVGVDRRHQAVLDADGLVGDLRERREAVRRARRVGDDVVLVGVVLVEVDAEADRDVLALGRRGDDDLLRAAVEVLGGVLAVGEEAGRLDDDVDAEVAPRQLAPGRARRAPAARRRRRRCRCRSTSTVPGYGPRIESYLSRWASVLASVRSLTATKSMSAPAALAARNRLRPMRPKPLIPTRTGMASGPPGRRREVGRADDIRPRVSVRR